MHSLPILLRVTLTALAVLVATHAGAHPMPASEIFLDLEANGVRAEMHLPLDRLQIAVGPRLHLDAATTTQTMNRAEVEKYVSEHFSILDMDGAPWNARFESVAIVAEGGASELQVRLWLSPRDRSTTGEERRHRRSVRTFRLRGDPIVHQLITHKIMVFIRRDDLRPKTTLPENVGRLTYRVHELTVAR
ncbi:MAG TPA: hypothetical protein VGF69_16760 [Thermoanaerobaculia bacterium]